MNTLLERDPELEVVAAAVEDAAAGRGSVVLVAGEAGIGKSALVRDAVTRLGTQVRAFRGACDDLLTPRTLGPFRDMARLGATQLAEALETGDRDAIFEAALEELHHPLYATVLVLEDLHWADDASLDVTRYLVRRVSTSRGVLVLTYRDDEVTGDHPFQRLLGALAGVSAHRVHLRGLTTAAVATLIGDRGLEAASLARITRGNPFFVTEVLGAHEQRVPTTVIDAVQARVAQLSPAARLAADQLAIVPTAVETNLAVTLVGTATLAELEKRGVCEAEPSQVAFRHELARRALEDALPAPRRMELHARFLTVLLDTAAADPSRLVHHARGAGDVARLVEYGPVAAREAARAGAHRQALAHYATLLSHLDRFDDDARAEILEGHAREAYAAGGAAEAVRSQLEATALRRRSTDPHGLGANLVWLSRLYWWAGRRTEAETTTDEAIDVLESTGEVTSELAMAYSRRAQMHMLAFDEPSAIPWAERASELARQLEDDHVLSHALNNLGASLWRRGDDRGEGLLIESARLARAVGADEDACRAEVNRAWQLLQLHRTSDARAVVVAALAFAEEVEQLGFVAYLRAILAWVELETGDLGAAEAHTRHVLGPPEHEGIAVIPALSVLGRVLARRDDPRASAVLDRALALAERSQELQRLGPVAAALGELAWLGEATGVPEVLPRTHELARQLSFELYDAELGYWRWKLGDPVDVAGDEPWARQVRGDWSGAAEAWRAFGQPYEQALALTESDRPDVLREGLAILDGLGATATARRVRRELRERGVRSVPRGPTAATRTNPAGLTGRQAEVLALLTEGLTNNQIAERLVVSVRTVDHHVSAILQKLEVTSRADAVERARSLSAT